MSSERSQEFKFDLASRYQEFKEREGYSFAVGIIGSSDNTIIAASRELVLESCRSVQEQIGRFAIVSGGTRGGVPEMALDIGRELGLPTVGVFPQDGSDGAAVEKIDFSIAVPNQPLSEIKWGSETSTLVSIPDAFILVGGKWGTLIEISMIMKRNDRLANKGLPLKPIIAVAGSGGLSDFLKEIHQILPVQHEVLFQVNSSEELMKAVINGLIQTQ